MTYNWQLQDWPHFRYDTSVIEDKLYAFAQKAGRISGTAKALSEPEHAQALTTILVNEAIKTSEIEGEFLSRNDVMSSVRRNLGFSVDKRIVKDKRAVGMADLMTDVRNSYNDTLNEEKLFYWHQLIFPVATPINVGTWRSHSEPMQIVSGAIGREKVHFEAPPSKVVPDEISHFISWYNETAPKGKNVIKHAPLRSAISHLYFETIHPFEDGNGRVGRAIAEKALFQSLGHPLLLSLSTTIEANKNAYYDALKNGQRSNEITEWINYFINMILDALDESEALIGFILKKTRLFDAYSNQMNERQLKVINRMLKEGPKGFEGGMTAKKYMSITQTSKPTATRDLQKLLEMGVLIASGGGRSTSYQIQFK
ncbi:MAG: Fic family protein [Maribacter sp.]